MTPCKIAAWVALQAALFGCLTVPRVERRGSDLVPREPASGRPEVVVRSSLDRAALARRLAEELAQAGALVHLGETSTEATARLYLVTLGEAANQEVAVAAGRVAIAPPAPVFSPRSVQPLLPIRAPGPPAMEESARPVWELRFNGLSSGSHLSVEEEHTLIEAVVLWIRNRAVD